jgi:ABC-type antimicrobial peptide transport system permease subunit
LPAQLLFFAVDVMGFFSIRLFGLRVLIFDISVTLQLAAIGVGVSSVIGFIGGLFPALRAARVP